MLTGALDNGLRYAVKRYGNAVGYCALSIRVGTRDEGNYHSGIAHFVEHTLFKGTSRKSVTTINNTLERLGGELNAYTTKEEIVLHATVLKKDLEKAASLLMEIATDAQFPEDDIEIEKGVVIDEIASYKDYPAEEIYDQFEERLFAGSDLSRPILGTEESVKAITSEELKRFRSQFFTPDRMVLTMVSPLSEEKMVGMVSKLVTKSSGGAPLKEIRAKALSPSEDRLLEGSAAGTLSKGFGSVTLDKENNEVNCVMGSFAPSLKDEQERLAAILLCNILGGPSSNSILGSNLRERHGWVYNVECNYTPYSDTGVATINFGCDKENLSRCQKAIRHELKKLIDTPLSPARLKAAKIQMLGQNAIGMENGEAQCLSMGKSILSFGRIAPDDEVQERIMSVSAEQLQLAAKHIFNPETISTLIFL